MEEKDFPIGTYFVLANKETLRYEYRGQRCVITESHPLFYKVLVETGEFAGRTVKLRKRTFNDTYKLYVKNKGRWIF